MLILLQGGTGLDSSSEKLRQVLKELDGSTNAEQSSELSTQARELIRSHLAENHEVVRDLQEKLRAGQEEGEIQAKRRMEVEKILMKRDAAYEELLGQLLHIPGSRFLADYMHREIHFHAASFSCGDKGKLLSFRDVNSC
jgi:hypothetical protein